MIQSVGSTVNEIVEMDIAASIDIQNYLVYPQNMI